MALALFLGLLGGCGATVEGQCDRVYTTACEHQVSCGLAADFATCDAEMREAYLCDYDKTVEEFQLCTQAEGTSCSLIMAEVCFEVLCDKVLGCIETEPNDTGNEF